MAKKQAQFRFEENFYERINQLAAEEGITVSEIVRNAISLYITLHNRTSEGNARLFIEYEDSDQPKCEVILPWILSK